MISKFPTISPNPIFSFNQTNSAEPISIPENHTVLTDRTAKVQTGDRGREVTENNFGIVVSGLAVGAGAVGVGVVVFVALTGLLGVVARAIDGGHGLRVGGVGCVGCVGYVCVLRMRVRGGYMWT